MSLTIGAVFLAGLLSFLSPCFLPVVPVLIGALTGVNPSGQNFIGVGHTPVLSRSGQSAGATVTLTAAPVRTGAANTIKGRQSLRRSVLLAVVFVLSFSAVFVGLWAAVAVIGWVVGDIKQYLTVAGGVVIIVLGLYVAGLVKLPFLDRVFGGARVAGRREPTVRHAILLGLSFGAGWTPCIGPVLGGVLGLTTTTDSIHGLALLAVYCVGLGVPFVLATLAADTLINTAKIVKKYYNVIELVLGLALVAVGFLMISGLLETLSASLPTMM